MTAGAALRKVWSAGVAFVGGLLLLAFMGLVALLFVLLGGLHSYQ